MPRPTPVIVEHLCKRYGRVEAVRDLTFDVGAGEIFGLIGPNGAGKTTTIECAIGLTEPDAGNVWIAGIDLRARPAEIKQKVGAALQTTALQDKITPREALELFGALYPRRVDAGALLARFGLVGKADATFDTLSGGQRQRLALALAFVNAPEVIVLDEPTAGLDPQSRRDLHQEIARMKDEGHTVLLSTHYVDEAEALCDRVAIIHRGQVVATGSPAELVAASHRTPRVRFETARPVDRADLTSLADVTDVAVNGTRADLGTPHVTRTLAELTGMLGQHGIELTSLRVQRATLEDVFLELTGSPAKN